MGCTGNILDSIYEDGLFGRASIVSRNAVHRRAETLRLKEGTVVSRILV